MTDPGVSDDRLTAHLIADLNAAIASLEQARLLLHDALLATSDAECRRKTKVVRNNLGSTLQIMSTAAVLATRIRERLVP